MYEEITYESILQRMLSRVSDKIDKREGSLLYAALAPAAIELQLMYLELDVMLKETFADTATREYLIKRAAERGILPAKATSAFLRAEFVPKTVELSIGERFSCNDLHYVMVKKIADGQYQFMCEKPGTDGNRNFGRLIPINYIKGLESAELHELLVPGEDEEDTEHLRQRYFDSLNAEAFGGNVKDYQDKINAIPGVGGVKVYPAWNGGGTVKLVIIASDYSVPSEALIEQVQEQIDPIQNQGQGVGIAPIGHAVTVEGVSSVAVNIAANITYQDGWSWEDIKSYAEQSMDDYFTELNAAWNNSENLVVRISQIEMRFLNLPGVVDIDGTTLSGEGQNLTIDKDSIPVRGELYG